MPLAPPVCRLRRHFPRRGTHPYCRGGKGAPAPGRWVGAGSHCDCQRAAARAAPTAETDIGAANEGRFNFRLPAPAARGLAALRRTGAGALSCPLSGGCRPQGGWGLFQRQSGPGQWDVPHRSNPHRFAEPPGRGHKDPAAPTAHWRGSALGSPTIGELLSESEAERCQAAIQIGSRIHRTSLDTSPSFASQMPPAPPVCRLRRHFPRRGNHPYCRGGKDAAAPARWAWLFRIVTANGRPQGPPLRRKSAFVRSPTLVPPRRGLREAVGVVSMRDIPLTRTALMLEQPPASLWSAAP